MVQYDHIYAAICIMIKLKVMFWKLYSRIYFNVGPFKTKYEVSGKDASCKILTQSNSKWLPNMHNICGSYLDQYSKTNTLVVSYCFYQEVYVFG